jgi:hypothetical protein
MLTSFSEIKGAVSLGKNRTYATRAEVSDRTTSVTTRNRLLRDANGRLELDFTSRRILGKLLQFVRGL